MSLNGQPFTTPFSGEGALMVGPDSWKRIPDASLDAQSASICNQLEQFSSRGYNCMKAGKWDDAKVAFMIVRGTGDQLQELGVQDGRLRLNAAECLSASGKHLITLIYLKEAISCFTLAISFLEGCSIDDRCADIMAHAIQSIVMCHINSNNSSAGPASLKAICDLIQFCPLYSHPRVQEGLGQAHLDLALDLIKMNQTNTASDILDAARGYFSKGFPSYMKSETEAQLLSALGYCLHMNEEARAALILRQAREIWTSLCWPLYEVDTIVNNLKCCIENHLRTPSDVFDDYQEERQLLDLHEVLSKRMDSMQVADTFTHLGMVAYHHGNELRAVRYFETSYNLYKNVTHKHNKNQEELIRLLRFVGVSSYNCRDFKKAMKAYHKCLSLLEDDQSEGSLSKEAQIAECSAALGFTYSRLRDFDNMLLYYEKALELESKLSAEDLELLVTNIGSLYHVKSALLRQQGHSELANHFNVKAKKAFSKALRYSWKSFPFINYGYYLHCQGDYAEAVPVLQQGYLNGVIDKDTVEFDHTEDPILIDDLKMELAGREDIRMPSTVVALYLKIRAQVCMGNITGAAQSASLLEQEAESCKYAAYYTTGYGVERMKALTYSLLGYSFKALGHRNRAIMAFKRALSIISDNDAAKFNIKSLRGEMSAGSYH